MQDVNTSVREICAALKWIIKNMLYMILGNYKGCTKPFLKPKKLSCFVKEQMLVAKYY